MSAENVQLARDWFAAWQREDIQWMLDHADPEIELVQPPEVPDAKSYHGHAGIVEAFEDWPKQWDSFRMELIDIVDVDEERTLMLTRHHMTARGMELTQDVAYLGTTRDGKGIRTEMYFSLDQARRAAGLDSTDEVA